MRPRLLYITHTAWGWIKQRPQFLAEGLAEHFDVDVMYRKSNHINANLNTSAEHSKEHLNVKGFRHLPLERLTFLPLERSYSINRILWKSERVNLKSYDYVWVTDAILWWNIKDEMEKLNSRGTTSQSPRLIYDCMDDALEFPYIKRYPKLLAFMKKCEKQLTEQADFVFCSSRHLGMRLKERYYIKRKIITVNNAISDEWITATSEKTIEKPSANGSAHEMAYIGTISEWFDFNLVISALDRYPTLRVKLYGPLRTSNTPQHERLEYMGPIAHDKVFDTMLSSTALMMPFVLNDLILSVNPVKLYEYILSGKPIVATRYGETEAFEKYVTLYSSHDDFFKFVEEQVLRPHTCDTVTMRQFALRNTWSARCAEIVRILEIRC